MCIIQTKRNSRAISSHSIASSTLDIGITSAKGTTRLAMFSGIPDLSPASLLDTSKNTLSGQSLSSEES